jgi:hypothetical protein
MIKPDDSILMKNIILNCIGSIVLLYVAYNFLNGVNGFNNKKIITQNRIYKIFLIRIIPVILIIASVWFSGEPILDYIIKDYKVNTGILTDINVPYKYVTTEELYIQGEIDPYYVPKGFIQTEEKGKLYEFKYGKRSRIIIEIHEVKNRRMLTK